MSNIWIGHIFCSDCFLKHVFEGKIERKIERLGKLWKRLWQLMEDLKEKSGKWKLK